MSANTVIARSVIDEARAVGIPAGDRQGFGRLLRGFVALFAEAENLSMADAYSRVAERMGLSNSILRSYCAGRTPIREDELRQFMEITTSGRETDWVLNIAERGAFLSTAPTARSLQAIIEGARTNGVADRSAFANLLLTFAINSDLPNEEITREMSAILADEVPTKSLRNYLSGLAKITPDRLRAFLQVVAPGQDTQWVVDLGISREFLSTALDPLRVLERARAEHLIPDRETFRMVLRGYAVEYATAKGLSLGDAYTRISEGIGISKSSLLSYFANTAAISETVLSHFLEFTGANADDVAWITAAAQEGRFSRRLPPVGSSFSELVRELEKKESSATKAMEGVAKGAKFGKFVPVLGFAVGAYMLDSITNEVEAANISPEDKAAGRSLAFRQFIADTWIDIGLPLDYVLSQPFIAGRSIRDYMADAGTLIPDNATREDIERIFGSVDRTTIDRDILAFRERTNHQVPGLKTTQETLEEIKEGGSEFLGGVLRGILSGETDMEGYPPDAIDSSQPEQELDGQSRSIAEARVELLRSIMVFENAHGTASASQMIEQLQAIQRQTEAYRTLVEEDPYYQNDLDFLNSLQPFISDEINTLQHPEQNQSSIAPSVIMARYDGVSAPNGVVPEGSPPRTQVAGTPRTSLPGNMYT